MTEPLFRSNGMSGEPLVLTDAVTAMLWDRMRDFPILFATLHETTFESFRAILRDQRTILVAFNRGGMLLGLGMVYDIIPGSEAKIQVTFFDRKMRGKEALVRSFVVWLFNLLPINRVAIALPKDARSTREFYERVGLVFEGCLRHWCEVGPMQRKHHWDQKYCDMFLYGVTRMDAERPLWRSGKIQPVQLVHFKWDAARSLGKVEESGIGQSTTHYDEQSASKDDWWK